MWAFVIYFSYSVRSWAPAGPHWTVFTCAVWSVGCEALHTHTHIHTVRARAGGLCAGSPLRREAIHEAHTLSRSREPSGQPQKDPGVRLRDPTAFARLFERHMELLKGDRAPPQQNALCVCVFKAYKSAR